MDVDQNNASQITFGDDVLAILPCETTPVAIILVRGFEFLLGIHGAYWASATPEQRQRKIEA